MQIEEAVLRVQTAYPRIYLACHSRHQNARTTNDSLSPRDSTLLAHLSETNATPQGDLAAHVGVAKSTLSEALTGLEERGFTIRQRANGDGREALILRTPAGTKAMSGSSVLEKDRLAAILLYLTNEERCRAVDGLELLARAAVQGATHAS
jgi:DNA-binding MarR family transcriptional regulator